MGCDGGTIPKRDELVKTKKKPEQKDKASELSFRWQHCALTQSPLNVPVVACELGRMYSKESIIENLIEKASVTPAQSSVLEPSTSSASASTIIAHIRSIKDIKTLNLTQNPDWTETTEVGDGYIDSNKSQWICPVSGHGLNGKFRFVFPWTCGCVFSEKALEMITKGTKDKDSFECLKCQKPFQLADIIVLNPTEETEIESLKTKMELRRAAAKAKKSSKSAKKNGEIASTSTSSSSAVSTSKDDKDNKNGEVSTSKVEKKRANGETSSSSTKKLKVEPPVSKISGAYSVAKDPRASDTFKSLFTSSEKAKSQNKAHWVTYNPFYN